MLGCGSHTARIVDRVTGATVATPRASRIQWGRRRDDISAAGVTYAKTADVDPGGLAGVRTWRHELEVSRDDEVVWVGPIVKVAENRTRVQVDALDRLAWLNVRVLRGTKTITATDPAGILGIVLAEALGRYDPIALRTAITPTAKTAALTWSFLDRVTAWAALRDILATYLDVTVVADLLYAGARTVPAGARATYSEHHFLVDADVVEDGQATSTIAHVRGGSGVVSSFPPEPADAPVGDDWWGVIDGVVDRNNLTTPADVTAAAKAAWRIGRRPPVHIDLPANARVGPDSPLTIAELIPGAQVDVSFTDGRIRPVTARFDIASVDVSEGSGQGAPRDPNGRFLTQASAGGEVVQITLSPAVDLDG